jgi:hypothetical protein
MKQQRTLVWDSRGLVATDPATNTVFDLTKGVNRIPLAQHIMSLLPGGMSIDNLLKKAGISKTYKLWFQVIEERGEDLIEAYQIISIGKVLGMSDWDILNKVDLPKIQPTPPAVKIPAPNSPTNPCVVEIPTATRPPCEAEVYDDGPEPRWYSDDIRGRFSDGGSFNLGLYKTRSDVYDRIKARNPYPSLEELFRDRRASWMKLEWFERVKSGTVSISGSQLESIAKVINASIYWLVFGEYSTSKTIVEEVLPRTVAPEAVVEVEEVEPTDVSDETLPVEAAEPEAELKIEPIPTESPVMEVILPLVVALPNPATYETPPVPVVVIEPPSPHKELTVEANLELLVLDPIVKPEELIDETPIQLPEPVTTEVVIDVVSEDTIVWDKSNTVATYRKQQFDLSDKELRSLLVDRIRFVKGFMTYGELMIKTKLKDRLPGWLSSLTLLTRKELEAIAKACGLSTLELLTGEGITPLRSNETATSWLKRFRKESPDGEAFTVVIEGLYEQLSEVHPALACQAIELLCERLRK